MQKVQFGLVQVVPQVQEVQGLQFVQGGTRDKTGTNGVQRLPFVLDVNLLYLFYPLFPLVQIVPLARLVPHISCTHYTSYTPCTICTSCTSVPQSVYTFYDYVCTCYNGYVPVTMVMYLLQWLCTCYLTH